MKTSFYDDLRIALINELEANAEAIRNEYTSLSLHNLSQDWHESGIYNQGWSVFGFKFQDTQLAQAYNLCPITGGILNKYDNLISTAGFSTLKPETIIYPHKGYTDTVLRLHLGVIVPEGDIAIRVGNDIRKWENGKCFVFDDTVEHEVWNRTQETRVALLIDIKKAELPAEALASVEKAALAPTV